ncbi:MAG: monovalent cation/H+ antiporter subunit D family protein [Nitrospinae bacterium]|nr:monovalent cation/H+ antiporter subunit D family protein [Nitrospinota bacterium]
MEHAAILIIVIPLLASFFNLLIGLWRKRLCYPFVVAALGLNVILSISVLNTVINSGTISYRLGGWAPPWGIEYVIDHLNAFILAIVSFISLIVAIYSKKSIEQELPGKTVYFYTIYLLLVTGLLGITVTGDVFNLFVFLEITSLAGYALIAIGRDKAPLASFNYVIMGTIGACFYLLGVGYLYIVTGSLNIADLAKLLPELYHSKVVLAAFAFFMVGVAIKIALFPLHVWLPDAYTYAPSTVSAFVASTMTKVGAYAMIRIMFTVFEPRFSIEMLPVTAILGWVAAAAMVYGCIMALAQTDLKRALSYILIAEVGYIVMGVSVANRAGFTGAVLHILNDAFMMACLFMVAGAVVYKTGSSNIQNLRGLHKKMPFTMAAFTIGAISMVGIPPTAGFFSKWYLILGAIAAQKWLFAVLFLLSSLAVAVVFFRIIQNVYFPPNESTPHPNPLPQGERGNMGGNPTIPPPLTGGGKGEGEIGLFSHEAPATMLIPIFIMTAGILLLGMFSGKIISSVIQFTVPGGF